MLNQEKGWLCDMQYFNKGGALHQECTCTWIIDVRTMNLVHSCGVYSSQLTRSCMTCKSTAFYCVQNKPEDVTTDKTSVQNPRF